MDIVNDDDFTPCHSQEQEDHMFRDAYAGNCLACMLAGIRLMHYGAYRLGPYFAKQGVTNEEHESLVRRAISRVKELSNEGFHSNGLLTDLEEVRKILLGDIEAETKLVRAEKATQFREGLATPYLDINTKAGGGLDIGDVLILGGDSTSARRALQDCYRFYNEHRMPITFYGTRTQKEMPVVPGVVNVPRVFWENRGTDLESMRETFEAANGYVVLVESLECLADYRTYDDHERARAIALKYLSKVAKRYKVAVIVVDDSPGTGIKGRQYLTVSVSSRRLDGREVICIGDGLYTEDEDGRLCVLGGGDKVASEVAGNDGRTEGALELQGPGEDSGEN